jgi:hypothetical protein
MLDSNRHAAPHCCSRRFISGIRLANIGPDQWGIEVEMEPFSNVTSNIIPANKKSALVNAKGTSQ